MEADVEADEKDEEDEEEEDKPNESDTGLLRN